MIEADFLINLNSRRRYVNVFRSNFEICYGDWEEFVSDVNGELNSFEHGKIMRPFDAFFMRFKKSNEYFKTIFDIKFKLIKKSLH